MSARTVYIAGAVNFHALQTSSVALSFWFTSCFISAMGRDIAADWTGSRRSEARRG
jgi:hypothetical protein